MSLAESLLHSLARSAAAGTGFSVSADKTEYIYNQIGDISILKGGPVKLMDKFTYLRSSVSSTENDINTR